MKDKSNSKTTFLGKKVTVPKLNVGEKLGNAQNKKKIIGNDFAYRKLRR